jgi:hypothetical protein
MMNGAWTAIYSANMGSAIRLRDDTLILVPDVR